MQSYTQLLFILFIQSCQGTIFTVMMGLQEKNIFLVDGGCYFPVEVQGEYVTQSMIDAEIAYTSITITYDSIPGWGRCHSRHGLRGQVQDLDP